MRLLQFTFLLFLFLLTACQTPPPPHPTSTFPPPPTTNGTPATILPTVTPFPTLTTFPTPPPQTSLEATLTEIYHRYDIDYRDVCGPNTTELDALYQDIIYMLQLLITHPQAADYSLSERAQLFNEITNINLTLYPSTTGEATLATYEEGNNILCGSMTHTSHRNHFLLLAADGEPYYLGINGRLPTVWWENGRFHILSYQKLNAISGPNQWELWQVGPTATDDWQTLLTFDLPANVYNGSSNPPIITYQDDFEQMTAELNLWHEDDPCQFPPDFLAQYDHGYWDVRNQYQRTNNSYQLTTQTVLTIPFNTTDGSPLPENFNWQDYCTDFSTAPDPTN
ncbi:MAG TPA: hypothetical protein VLL52_21430 [Anaerolineae bacterium]|nr:hypothetical protein [Anaerolineae bacterium]